MMPMIMQQYKNEMVEARVIFSKVVNRLISQCQQRELASFLLHHCVFSHLMSQPLNSWVCDASTRCQQLGFIDLSCDLKEYADIGFRRDKLLRADLDQLVLWFNKHYFWELNAESFLRENSCEGLMQYFSCHEQALSGDTPYTELAIQFELERLEMIHGYSLLQLCTAYFGKSILRHLSAFRHKMRLNHKRTTLLAQMMERFLAAHPDKLSSLHIAAIDTLQSYAQYLLDCHQLAVSTGSSLACSPV